MNIFNMLQYRKCKEMKENSDRDILRITSSELTKTTDTEKKILKAVPGMFLSQCSVSHILFFPC